MIHTWSSLCNLIKWWKRRVNQFQLRGRRSSIRQFWPSVREKSQFTVTLGETLRKGDFTTQHPDGQTASDVPTTPDDNHLGTDSYLETARSLLRSSSRSGQVLDKTWGCRPGHVSHPAARLGNQKWLERNSDLFVLRLLDQGQRSDGLALFCICAESWNCLLELFVRC